MSVEVARKNHAESLKTLEILNDYQDYMDNISVVADMGCGYGYDAAWFANLTTIGGKPRNIKVNAVDIELDTIYMSRHENINYIQTDYTQTNLEHNSHDLIWAHDSLQYSIAPIYALYHWWQLLKVDGMLFIKIPYNFSVDNHKDIQKINCTYKNGCFYNWTMGNLILSLVATGFDCKNAHFKLDKEEGYMYACVYKLPELPTPGTNWYHFADKKLLPLSIEKEIMKNGTFKETDIVVEWIDRSQYMLSLL